MNHLKPFTVQAHRIDGDMLDQMEKNGLSKNNVVNRIVVQRWDISDAVGVPKGGERKLRRKDELKRYPQNNVRSYFMPLDEVWGKYGKPGEIRYPERLNTSKKWI